MEGGAWKCTVWLWDGALAHSVTLIHKTRCPPMCEATFKGKEAISSSTSSITTGTTRYAFREALDCLKYCVFFCSTEKASAQLTSIQGQAAILVSAGRVCAPHPLFFPGHTYCNDPQMSLLVTRPKRKKGFKLTLLWYSYIYPFLMPTHLH